MHLIKNLKLHLEEKMLQELEKRRAQKMQQELESENNTVKMKTKNYLSVNLKVKMQNLLKNLH